MEVKVNNTTHDVPFSLSGFSLGKFVEYYEKYGKELDQQFKALIEKTFEGSDDLEKELNREIDFDIHLDNEALAWYSFWTGYDLFEARDEKFIQPILDQYRVFRWMLKESEEEAKNLPMEMEWNEETWAIQDWAVTPRSDMSFNEIITSKEVVRQVYKLGKGKWDALPYLCAIFFRKKDEPFDDILIQEGSDRMELIKQLPMSTAIVVAFFLIASATIWQNTLVVSAEKEEEAKSLT